MIYILTILILISSVSASASSAYLYNPDAINLFYKACDCSNNNIEFCTNLIEKVSANNNNFNDMKSIKIITLFIIKDFFLCFTTFIYGALRT